MTEADNLPRDAAQRTLRELEALLDKLDEEAATERAGVLAQPADGRGVAALAAHRDAVLLMCVALHKALHKAQRRAAELTRAMAHAEGAAPRAVVVPAPGGGVAIVDDTAAAVARSVAAARCRDTFEGQRARVDHFRRRILERGDVPWQTCIVLLNVDDPNGGPIARALMPGNETEWAALRLQGLLPFARGLAVTEGIVAALEAFAPEAATGLRGLVAGNKVPCVVVDHGGAAAFDASPPWP